MPKQSAYKGFILKMGLTLSQELCSLIFQHGSELLIKLNGFGWWIDDDVLKPVCARWQHN